MRNRVVYYAKQDKDGAIKLIRMVDGGASTLAGDLELVRFSYWDERGRAALVPAQIRRVVVEITRRHAKHKVTAEVSLRS
jgi:hypothetical protein